MNSRLVEELARQRHAEHIARTTKPRPVAYPYRRRGPSLRSYAGWAIVAVGLRIAESGSKPPSVATANHWR